MNVLAYDLVDVFWLMVWFFLFFAWAADVAKLTELHERGLLTDEEYVRERMRALG